MVKYLWRCNSADFLGGAAPYSRICRQQETSDACLYSSDARYQLSLSGTATKEQATAVCVAAAHFHPGTICVRFAPPTD